MNTPAGKPARLFDIRTIERNIARGLVTPEEYEAWLSSLPDEAEEGEDLATEFVHTNRADDEQSDAE